MKKGVSAIVSLVVSSLFTLIQGIQASDSLLPPSCLISVDEQDGYVPLHWFKPGSRTGELAYDDGTKEHQSYVSDRWVNNKAAVRMSSPFFPFALLKSKVFISYQGAENDTLYDFQIPFLISVYLDSGGVPGQVLWGPFAANATGLDSSSEEGEWVKITHNLFFLHDSDFWIVFHWQENSPTAPLIGEDDSTNSGRSFYYALNDYGYFEWKEWSGYNLMIRSVIVADDSGETLNSPDGFKIYRSEEPGFSLSTENLRDSVGADRFSYIDDDVENGETYFYKLTTIHSGEESASSDEAQATPKRGANLLAGKNLIEVSLDTNQTQLEYLNLSNAGGMPLDFEIEISRSTDDSTGGTDHFGYSWTDNREKPGLEFEWIDISGTGVSLNPDGPPDYTYGPVFMGFSFPFYGDHYDSVWIMLNGCLRFSPVKLLKWKNDILPNSQTPLTLIAPFWSNLWFDDSTKIYYYSTSDSFVVSFTRMKHFISGKYCTFQTILTEKGEVDFQYKRIEDPSTPATVGMQNEDGSCGLLISYNQWFTEDSLRVRIVPGWIQIEPRNGHIAPAEDLTLNLFFNSDFLDTGKYSASLSIGSRDRNQQLEPLDVSLIFDVGAFQDTVSDTTRTDTSTAVLELEKEKLIVFLLQQNYPNPFNTTTIIPFTVHGKRETVNGPIPTSLKIYNVKGELVKVLVDEKKPSGDYKVIWDGKNQKGEDVASGIYFYKLKAGNLSETKKMILIR